MRIVRLTAENFMRLVAIEIKPEDNTILITGKNGAGKSSVLEAIFAALGGKKALPTKPIRDGQESAHVEVETEDFTAKLKITKKGSYLTITNRDGSKSASPQALLDRIVGKIAFDPMSFSKEEPRRQRSILMNLLGLDFSDIDKKQQEIKVERSIALREKERLQHEVERIPLTTGVPADEISHAELTTKLKDAMEHNAQQQQLDAKVNGAEERLEGRGTGLVNNETEQIGLQTNIEEEQALLLEIGKQQKPLRDVTTIEKEIAELTTKLRQAIEHNNHQEQLANQIVDAKSRLEASGTALDNLQAKHDELRQLVEQEQAGLKKLKEAQTHLEDVSAIEKEIAEVEQKNALIRQNKEKARFVVEAGTQSKLFTSLGQKAKALESERAERLAKVEMPVAGLSVTEECVVFDGIPLTQVNSSKQLEVGIAISMALNPTLRVLRINGNGLDTQTQALLSKMVKDHDYQLWEERTDETGKVGIVIEEGSVK